MRFLYEEWLWGLLLLIPLIWLQLRAARQRKKTAALLGEPAVVERLIQDHRAGRRGWKAVLQLLGVTLLILTLARPQFGTRLELVKREGQDLVIALDTSTSMLAEDIKPDRLTRARIFVKDLLSQLEGDRVALVTFAGDAFLHCPLTVDYGAAKLFLEAAHTGINPTQGTDIAQAIRVAITAFPEEEEAGHRMLLLLTDGEDHGGEAARAAKEAAREGVRVFVVGFGSEEGQSIPLVDERGERSGFKKDERGEVVRTRLGEGTLREIAEVADGMYCRASGSNEEISRLKDELSGMKTRELEARQVTVFEDRFQYPLLLGVCFLAGDIFITTRAKRRKREHGGRFE